MSSLVTDTGMKVRSERNAPIFLNHTYQEKECRDQKHWEMREWLKLIDDIENSTPTDITCKHSVRHSGGQATVAAAGCGLGFDGQRLRLVDHGRASPSFPSP